MPDGQNVVGKLTAERRAELRGWWACRLGVLPSTPEEELLQFHRMRLAEWRGLPETATWIDIFACALREGDEPEVPHYAPEKFVAAVADAKRLVGKSQ